MNFSKQNLICIISDTHDQIKNLKRIIEFCNKGSVSLVVHCGDWVSPFTQIHYAKLNVPLYGVFGNNDGDKLRHIEFINKFGVNATLEDQFLSFKYFDKRIAVYHGDYIEIVNALINCGEYDTIFSGHNHRSNVRKYGEILSLNPGTLVDYTNDDVQGASFGLYDYINHEGRIIKLKDFHT